MALCEVYVTDSIANATHPKSTKSRKSNFLVQIQITQKSHVELYRETARNLSFSILWN